MKLKAHGGGNQKKQDELEIGDPRSFAFHDNTNKEKPSALSYNHLTTTADSSWSEQ
jgi:hypothetical protein